MKLAIEQHVRLRDDSKYRWQSNGLVGVVLKFLGPVTGDRDWYKVSWNGERENECYSYPSDHLYPVGLDNASGEKFLRLVEDY
jgi:hypothetical protein